MEWLQLLRLRHFLFPVFFALIASLAVSAAEAVDEPSLHQLLENGYAIVAAGNEDLNKKMTLILQKNVSVFFCSVQPSEFFGLILSYHEFGHCTPLVATTNIEN